MSLREAERKRQGRDAQLSAAIINAQSVKTIEEFAGSVGLMLTSA
jgi:hypothetical protein